MNEFGVHSIQVDDHAGSVTGRCYRGVLRVGTVFTSFEDEGRVARPVRLEITRIEAYQRELDEIEEGLTARLHLVGDGWSLLRERGVLSARAAEPR